MNRPVTFDAALATSRSEKKPQVRLLALWPFVLVVAILATVALVSESRFTPDQRERAGSDVDPLPGALGVLAHGELARVHIATHRVGRVLSDAVVGDAWIDASVRRMPSRNGVIV